MTEIGESDNHRRRTCWNFRCTFEATDILGNASDTAKQVDEDMENGLGSALRKLYEGCIGESKYAKYKTKRG